MLARRVDVDEIVRQTCPADQPSRAAVRDQRGRAPVSFRQMQSVSGPAWTAARLRRSAFRLAPAKLPAKRRPRSDVSQLHRVRAFPQTVRGHRSGASNATAQERARRSRRSERRRACDWRGAPLPAQASKRPRPSPRRRESLRPRPPSPENFSAFGRPTRGQGAVAARMRPQRRCLCRETTPLRSGLKFPPSAWFANDLDSFPAVCKYVYQRDRSKSHRTHNVQGGAPL